MAGRSFGSWEYEEHSTNCPLGLHSACHQISVPKSSFHVYPPLPNSLIYICSLFCPLDKAFFFFLVSLLGCLDNSNSVQHNFPLLPKTSSSLWLLSLITIFRNHHVFPASRFSFIPFSLFSLSSFRLTAYF